MTSIAEMIDLRGRVALVTGASGGIGRAISKALAELKCELILLDHDQTKLDQQVAQLQSEFSIRAVGLKLDLEDAFARNQIQDRVSDQFAHVDILINNAAFVGDSGLTGWAVPLPDQEIETWRRAIEVNLTASFHLTQLLAQSLGERGRGSVVNIGSIYGVVGPDWSLYEGTSMGNPAAYAASKGGVVQLTRWLSTVLAPDIRVNCISPGGVLRSQPEEFIDRYEKRTPLGRMATEIDIVGAVAYLASDLSMYVTGQNLVVDGGWTVW